jgi:hypothetical protein
MKRHARPGVLETLAAATVAVALLGGAAEARREYGARCARCHGTQRPPGALNLRALHDPTSSQYDSRCLVCHRKVLRARTLNKRIPDIHRAMIRALRMKAKRSCTFCHYGVDFDRKSAGNNRRQVDVEQCAVCHQQGAEGRLLYVR